MKTAIHLRTDLAPATFRDTTTGLKRLASGLLLAASVSAMSLIVADPALAQTGSGLPATGLRNSAALPDETARPVPPGLTGAAWNLANQAYLAYNQKDYRRTIPLVEKALKLRPDVPQLWLLLMDALEADGRLPEAIATGKEAVASGIKDPALLARLRAQAKIQAQAPSLAANKALEAHDAKTAIAEARKAIDLVPDDLSYHMLLVYALLADHRLREAEQAAEAAVATDPTSFLPRLMRGYLRERLGRIKEANADFDDALKDEVLTGETERNARIIVADAALAAGNPGRALAVLKPLGDRPDPAVALRMEAAEALKRDKSLMDATAYQDLPVPFQKCVDTPYGPVCSLLPAATPPGRGAVDTPGFVTAQAAFAAYREGNDAMAEELIREALKLNPGNTAWHRLLINTLERANKLPELEAAIKDAVEKTGDDSALETLRLATDKRLAEPDVKAAITALKEGHAKKAVDLAQKAVARSPDTMTFRIVLIDALIASGDNRAALNAADAALNEDPNDPLARVLQAWLLQKTGKPDHAAQAFSDLLGSDILTDAEIVNFRLIAANAALARGDAAGALALLEPLEEGKSGDVKTYRQLATRLSGSRATAADARALALEAPNVLCQPTNYGVICSVFFGAPGTWIGGTGVAAAPGYQAANSAYRALERRDYRAAVALARKALSQDPSNSSYSQLLLTALTGAGQYAEAEKLLDRMLAHNPRDAALLVQRGNVRLQAHQYAGAIHDYRAALNSGHLSRTQKREVRFALADAALGAKNPDLALWALQPLAGEQSYAVQSRLGFTWLAQGNKEEALAAFDRAARFAHTHTERNAMLSARINVLNELGRREEARTLFMEAYERGDLKQMRLVELAILSSQAGEDDLAYELFTQANDEWQLRGTSLITAAYNARRTYHNEQAVDYLKAAIDEHHDGKLPLDPQYLFGLRREVEQLTRTWGFYLSASYGAAGIAPNTYLVGPTNISGKHTLGLGGEIYWRPPHIGYRDGALFELFARGFATAYDENGGPTGSSTFQPSVGARWKPFKSENLVLEASYLFPAGKYTREDWLLRVAYSRGEGTDLRVDVDNWRAWQIYADYNYYTSQPQTVSTFELRYGHAYRMDAISDRLVLWPFLAFGGSYDTGYATPFGLGIGPGLTARYWFNEDEYTAPRSYLDLSAQYRIKLAGDDRAEGLFAGAFLSY
ncbi:NfrA family protein [Xanthobacter sp. TB0139]